MTRSDPSQSKPLITEYGQDLNLFFKSYIRIAKDRIQGSFDLKNKDITPEALVVLLGATASQYMKKAGKAMITRAVDRQYQHGVRFATQELAKVGQSGASQVLLPSDRQAKRWLISQQSSAVSATIDKYNAAIIQRVAAGGVLGEPQVGDLDDLEDGTEKSGMTLAAAVVMVAVGAAILLRYTQNEVQYVMWQSELGPNTCDECWELDGQIFPIGAAPDCPAHPNCVCILVPVSEEGEEEKMPIPTAEVLLVLRARISNFGVQQIPTVA